MCAPRPNGSLRVVAKRAGQAVNELSVHDAIYTLRAMRRLKPDPVSDEDLSYLIDAATQAPTAGNAQDWAFVIVTEPAQRSAIGDVYRRLGTAAIRDGALRSGALTEPTERVYRNALILVENLGAAPALVLIAKRGPPPTDPSEAAAWYGSIFPAVQNLMLAARSRGLGTTLTTLHTAREGEIRAIVGMPDDFTTVALIPVGHPHGHFGRPLRTASAEVTHWNRFGQRRG